MNEPLRPTVEAMEAALSAFKVGGRTTWQLDEGKLSEEINAFYRGALASKSIPGELADMAKELNEAAYDAKVGGWVTLNLFRYLQKVTLFACMFFWVGWNARGAIEESEPLKRMAESDGQSPSSDTSP